MNNLVSQADHRLHRLPCYAFIMKLGLWHFIWILMLAISICKLDLEFEENWFIHHTTAMLNEPRIRSLRLKKSIGLSGSRITLAMEREKKDALDDWKLRKKARTPFLKPRRSEEYTWQVNTWPILDNPINAGCIWAKARTRIITLRLGYKRHKTNAAMRGMFYCIALKTRLSETLLLFVVTCRECCVCTDYPGNNLSIFLFVSAQEATATSCCSYSVTMRTMPLGTGGFARLRFWLHTMIQDVMGYDAPREDVALLAVFCALILGLIVFLGSDYLTCREYADAVAALEVRTANEIFDQIFEDEMDEEIIAQKTAAKVENMQNQGLHQFFETWFRELESEIEYVEHTIEETLAWKPPRATSHLECQSTNDFFDFLNKSEGVIPKNLDDVL